MDFGAYKREPLHARISTVMLKKRIFGLFLTLILTSASCLQAQDPVQPNSSVLSKQLTHDNAPQPKQDSPSVQPSVLPASPLPSSTPSRLPSLLATPSPEPSNTDSANPMLDKVKSLVISMDTYYVAYNGTPVSLRVLLKDENQKSLFFSPVPFAYSSSRPEDIRISASGELHALKPFGFSEITVSLVGTSLQTKHLFNISTASQSSGGGGGSSTNSPSPIPSATPVEQIQASVNFQF